MNWKFWRKPVPKIDLSKMKLGKGVAKRDKRTLALCAYSDELKPAPLQCNLTGAITNLGMMLNDQLGDCTCATVGHIIQQWTAEIGDQIIITDGVVEALYEAVGNFNPQDPSTDQGAVILDVLNYWKSNPVAGNILDAFVYIDSTKVQELRNAVYYFGNAYIGVQLPISAQTQDVWDVTSGDDSAIGSWGGHAIPIVAYDNDFVYCITWGAIKKMTWAFYMKYVDEAYALLSPDWFSVAKSPEGFDFVTLQRDLALLRR